jgi:hypothetical protein
MKKIRLLMFAPALLLAFGSLAQAQFTGPEQYGPAAVTALVHRVHADLNHAYGGFRFTHSDRNRLNHAEKELRDFAMKWNRGNFDKGELDDAISSLQHVLDNNHLPVVDRDALSSDANQLRNMREAYDRHEIRGARH